MCDLDFNAGVFSESFLKLLSGYMIGCPHFGVQENPA